ncbi:MAG: 16S rRNA (cytosine(1402)-N(4))-methyltransferase RsmH [Patescibacteria group bacterium]
MDHHKPVLLREVLDYLNPKDGQSYLDLTAGYGGHSSAVLTRVGKQAHVVLVDRDQDAINELKQLFDVHSNVTIMQTDFNRASKILLEKSERFDLILADIGVSSLHLDKKERGFSLKSDGPLDMRMDQRSELNAYKVVNEYNEDDLARVLSDYGEIKNARYLARQIVDNRPFNSTLELADFVASKNRTKKWHKVHPATTVFQAIRIEVNDELGLLEASLPLWFELLKPGGKLAVISFQSLEDRIVKKFVQSLSADKYEAVGINLTKKVVTPADDELVYNPRSRSAKLRVVAKIKTNKEGDVNADSG